MTRDEWWLRALVTLLFFVASNVCLTVGMALQNMPLLISATIYAVTFTAMIGTQPKRKE